PLRPAPGPPSGHSGLTLFRRDLGRAGRRLYEAEGNRARQAVDNIPMLGELAVLDAEEIGRGEAQLVAGGGAAEERAVLRAGPDDADGEPVAFGHHLVDLGVIVAEARVDRRQELLPAGEARNEVGIVLDEVDGEAFIGRLDMAPVDQLLDAI